MVCSVCESRYGIICFGSDKDPDKNKPVEKQTTNQNLTYFCYNCTENTVKCSDKVIQGVPVAAG